RFLPLRQRDAGIDADSVFFQHLRAFDAAIKQRAQQHTHDREHQAKDNRALLSAFEVVVWMTDGWPLYESRLKGKLHVISKRYTQRIERHNLNLRQHLARLVRKSLSFSKSVELHDKVIGHYLNIKHYQ
ncbi:IS1 family transposase, partial [Shigella flexneri]|uniref:IS1 family transposase n=1 Tax=Shigella flexneri TaxID=623 RepID=UPI001EE72471